MIHIEIREIKNGFIVELFDDAGPAELDKTIFLDSFDAVLKEILKWFRKEKGAPE